MPVDKIPIDKKHYMQSLDIPQMESFDDLADELRLSRKLIYWLTKESAEGKYITSEKKKKSGGTRRIDAPVESLKTVQRWILKKILYKIKCSEYSYGFAKNTDSKESPQVTVAKKHKNNIFLLKLDIKDFYPSISRAQVFYQFHEIGYGINVSNLLTNVCTYNGVLPQGAPTSAYFANLICRRLDRRIGGYCNKRNIIYTRYADDMIFSSDEWGLLHGIYGTIKRIIEDEGFKLNEDKTNFAGWISRKEVLGITINDQKIKSPKDMKRMVRAMIHKDVATGDYTDIDRIKGYISYIKSIEKDYETKIKRYVKGLSESELCLQKDVVDSYNAHKIFSDLPDMVLKKPSDFKMGVDQVLENEEAHNDFLLMIDEREHPERISHCDPVEDSPDNPFE